MANSIIGQAAHVRSRQLPPVARQFSWQPSAEDNARNAFSRDASDQRESRRKPSNDVGASALLPRAGIDTLARSLPWSPVREARTRPNRAGHQPPFIIDLNLDQVIDAIVAGKVEYNLRPFFYAPLNNAGEIAYRHEIMCDIENEDVLKAVNSFAQTMHEMREHLSKSAKLYYKHQKESWFLDAVEIYCDGVTVFSERLATADVRSRGFIRFREYLSRYIEPDRFTSLREETRELKAGLAEITFNMIIGDGRVTVRNYEAEPDYSIDVLATFERFKQAEAKDYLAKVSASEDMNHIEAAVLDFVARLHPDLFKRLDGYCTRNRKFVDKAIGAFDREVQFYVAYRLYRQHFTRAGLTFCFPEIATESKEVWNREGFDLALARKLIGERASIVCNDFYLAGQERILVVSGPNQGGKTTFARAFGQLHYLASLGCPVPGKSARLFLFDQLFTHFERQEDIQTLRGKLEDDLVRIHAILTRATPRSLVIMNEIFNSTTLSDQILLSKRVLERITALDCLCICVSFIDELASLNEKVVSMVSTVAPDNPAERTFKIVRRPADGLAYAMAIAEKYRLTYTALKERIKT